MSVRERIRSIVRGEPSVRFALLFGSRARGGARPDSDWDVAVYLDDSLSAADRFRMRARLAARLEEAGPADVAVLNDADALLGRKALQGELLEAADRTCYARYFVRTMAEAEDRRYFDEILVRGRARRLAEGTFGRP